MSRRKEEFYNPFTKQTFTRQQVEDLAAKKGYSSPTRKMKFCIECGDVICNSTRCKPCQVERHRKIITKHSNYSTNNKFCETCGKKVNDLKDHRYHRINWTTKEQISQ